MRMSLFRGRPSRSRDRKAQAVRKKFTVTADKDGIARITDLAPGDYWLDAEYLNIGAAYHCFHVKERPSRKAKRNLTYD